jgi:2-polyprenyl-3-methyl-5-hydroxy-6-metoxy-1,4-benzoquinol methylase
MMKNFKECPFCGGKIVKRYSGLRDRLYTTKKTFSVSECLQCSAALLNPMPTGDVSMYYPTNYLSGEEETKATSSGFDIEKWYRYNQYKFDFGLLSRVTGKKLEEASSYVDIGCGSGERVTFAIDQGCKESFGVDKFDFAKSKSKKEVRLINSEILDYKPKKKFEVASLFHVMEHVENPQDILVHIRKHILKTDGHIIVQVPNYGSFERHVFKARWFSFDVPRHIWQFNERALVQLLEDAGYKIDATYQLNAALHPVTIVPSMFRELDIQRIWVNRTHGIWYKRIMTMLWGGFTILTIPLNIIQNLFRRSSMLTIIASSK